MNKHQEKEGVPAMTLYEYDRSLGIEGILCGVDEAGRGPLAGDVYAAAVILDPDNPIDGKGGCLVGRSCDSRGD